MQRPQYTYDLHIHTTASDGGYSPRELVNSALGLGMRVIAFTDHDTLASNAEGVSLGERLGLKVIPGVELTTQEMYHILGYYLSPGRSGLSEYLAALRERAWAFMSDALKSLRNGRGIRVTEDELARRTGEGIPNMAHLLDILFERGDIDEIAFDSPSSKILFGDPDYMVNYFREFSRLRPFTDAAGAVRLILSAGGVPVWAHPMQVDQKEVLRLKKAGLVGLEVTTPKHDEATRRALEKICTESDLIPTGGTDYHGRYFDTIEKGRLIGTCGVQPQIISRLEELASGLKMV
ncbi:MAG TPA: PHP domain-containing protein [archaeon]|nr:PHP domain-containing protein [archaeon]